VKLTFDIPDPPASWPLGDERWGADIHAAIGLQIHKLAQRISENATAEQYFHVPMVAMENE
jgi:hypothetical protein